MSRQFDVHRHPAARTPADPIYLVNLQADLSFSHVTIVVAPLWPLDHPRPSEKIAPLVSVAGRTLVLSIPELAFIRPSDLGVVVGNLAAERDRIIRALDLLFLGI